MITVKPETLIDYKRNLEQLEELIIYLILVAGGNSNRTITSMEKLDAKCETRYPLSFDNIRQLCVAGHSTTGTFVNQTQLANILKECGFRLYNQRANFLLRAYNTVRYDISGLRKASVDELEKIPGIGMKSARLFLMATRPNVQLAALDTHIMKFLRDNEYINADEKLITPTSKRKYKRFESIFLNHVPKPFSPAEYDLAIWNIYARGKIK